MAIKMRDKKAGKKILYFTRGFRPTDEERAEAEALGADVQFRNARFAGGKVEPCDAVAGKIPPAYDEFPRAQPGKAGAQATATAGDGWTGAAAPATGEGKGKGKAAKPAATNPPEWTPNA